MNGEWLGGPLLFDAAEIDALCPVAHPDGWLCTLLRHPADAYHEAWGTPATDHGDPPRPFRWWLDDGRGPILTIGRDLSDPETPAGGRPAGYRNTREDQAP